MPDGFDLRALPLGFHDDPYAVYRHLRESDPLHRMPDGSLFLTRPTLNDYIRDRGELDAAAAALWEVVGSGAVRIDVGQRFPLAEARGAHEALEGRRTTGSTLLMP